MATVCAADNQRLALGCSNKQGQASGTHLTLQLLFVVQDHCNDTCLLISAPHGMGARLPVAESLIRLSSMSICPGNVHGYACHIHQLEWRGYVSA